MRYLEKNKRIVCLALTVIMTAACLGGCKEVEKSTEIVLTTEFAEDEVFRINRKPCILPEVNVYMRTTQDQYESVFGAEIMDKEIDGDTLGNQLKDTILARLAQIKVMNLLAEDRGIELSEDETKLAQEAAEAYVSQLSEQEISDMKITKDIVAEMYGEYALANKIYEVVTKDVNPEISDDEARTITVKHILIKDYDQDLNGSRLEVSDAERFKRKAKARRILESIKGGEDFDEMAKEYSDDEQVVYSFGKGTMPEAFEKAAFNLDNDELSDIVETEYGFHIIKCVSTFDKQETDANKEKIVQERKNEAFNETYSSFVETLYSNLNEDLWNSLDFSSNPDVTTTNFFDVYNEYFK